MMKVAKEVGLALACTIVISLMFAGISYAVIDPKTCVGMWLFDEGDGDVAKDSSGNGNDGDFTGKPKYVDGKFGTALEFDGAGAGVEIDLDVLDLNKDQSFSVWFKTEIDADIHAIVLQAPFGGGYRFWMWIMRSGHGARGKLGFGYRAGDLPLEKTSAMPVNDDVWHHAVGVFDHKTKEAPLYIDGARSAMGSIAGIDFNLPVGQLCIATACGGSFLPGTIDEVAVFNVALDEDEVNEIMDEGLEGALGLTPVRPAGKLAAVWAAVKAQ